MRRVLLFMMFDKKVEIDFLIRKREFICCCFYLYKVYLLLQIIILKSSELIKEKKKSKIINFFLHSNQYLNKLTNKYLNK